MPPAAKPQEHKEPIGPVVAIVIILALMLWGAVYFFKAQQEVRLRDQLPYITGDTSTTTDFASGSTTIIDITATSGIQQY